MQDRLAPAFLSAGFAPHPAFPPGYDKASRAYHQKFLAPPEPDGLRLINLTYDPTEAAWDVTGNFHPCADAAAQVAHLGRDARTWTTALSHLPRRDSVLIPNAGWAFWRSASRQIDFDRRSGLPVGLQQNLDDALRGMPEFLDHLGRPALKGTKPSILPNYGLYD